MTTYPLEAPSGCYPNRRRPSTIEPMGFSNRSAPPATTPDERVFIGASYLDLAEADADFEALRQSWVDLCAAADFDAVTIGRKASGEVRFHREPDRSQGSVAGDHAAPSLAAGLGAALFPSVAADIPVGRLEEREILGTVAGVVAIALGRSGLSEFGDQLDSSSAGLIAVGTAEQQDRIRTALTNAHATIARVGSVDVERIVQTTDRVHRAASKRRRTTP